MGMVGPSFGERSVFGGCAAPGGAAEAGAQTEVCGGN